MDTFLSLSRKHKISFDLGLKKLLLSLLSCSIIKTWFSTLLPSLVRSDSCYIGEWMSCPFLEKTLLLSNNMMGFPDVSVVKNLLATQKTQVQSPGGGHGNPLQYSCLENPMDRGAWWAVGSQRVGHDWRDWACTHDNMTSLNTLVNYPWRT